jgi:predicted transcriptional regulator YheO
MNDIEAAVRQIFASVAASLGTASLARLPAEDKRKAVQLLDQRGMFQVRNAVQRVAHELAISNVTVYKYLRGSPRSPLGGD